jgi:hypothetical protein
MVRYFYAWTPLVVLGTLVPLALPGLALIALMIAAVAVLAALAVLGWAIVAAPLALGRAIGHGSHGPSAARQPSPALLLAQRSARSSR